MSISQRIPNILNGVSQQPQALRHPSQATEQINALSLPSVGVAKRPPLQSLAKLNANTTDIGYWVHKFRFGATRFVAVIANGFLEVYDELTGTNYPVTMPQGAGYLNGSAFRAVTVGERTYILNRDKLVAQGRDSSPTLSPQALIAVRQVDFSTNFVVTIDNTSLSYTTPDATDPKARQGITTDYIAQQLYDQMTSGLLDYNFTLLGSTIVVARKDGADFTISTSDGLADQGVIAIKASVQAFTDLPDKAVNGFRVQVTGDDSSNFASYWVEYVEDTTATGRGVWKECAAPGTVISIDPTSMPWRLDPNGVFVPNTACLGDPSAPSVTDGSTQSVTGGATSTGNGDPTNSTTKAGETTTSPDIDWANPSSQHADYVRFDPTKTLTGLTMGKPHMVSFQYNVDTSVMDPGTKMQLTLYHDPGTGAAMTPLASKSYDAGQTYFGENLIPDNPVTINAGESLVVQSTYSDGITPVQPSRRAGFVIPAVPPDVNVPLGVQPPAITMTNVTTRNINFDAAAIYPACTLHIALAGGVDIPVGITSGMTGTQAANAVLSAINNSGQGWPATLSGTSVVVAGKNTGDPAPPVVVTVDWNEARQCWLIGPGQTQFASMSLVNRYVRNLTDGSIGVVQSNDGTSVTVSALQGGGANRFQKGDIITIVATAWDSLLAENNSDVVLTESGDSISTEALSFVFSPEVWDDRQAGDIANCPAPSFINHSLQDIFYFEGRLGVTWGQSIVLSQAAKSTNFWRQSAQHLLDDDRVDITSAHPKLVTFDSVVEWEGGLLINGDDTQFLLTGMAGRGLTPSTVSLGLLSDYPVAPSVRPFIAGTPAFLAWSHQNANGTFGHLSLYRKMYYTGVYEAQDETDDLPTYINGNPLEMVGDSAIGILFFRTDGPRDSLFVYTFKYQQSMMGPQLEKQLSGWSRWQFPGATIVGMNILEGVLTLVIVRADGTYLENLNILTPPNAGVVYADNGTIDYQWQYTPSAFFLRDKQGEPQVQGILKLYRLYAEYTSTGGLQATITPTGRAAYSVAKADPTVADGTLIVPLNLQSTQFTLTLTSTDRGPVSLTGFEWEGEYTTRSRPA